MSSEEPERGARERLEEALGELERAARGGALMDRGLAREILVPLGELLRDGGEGAALLEERVRRATLPRAEDWGAAVHAELALACAEHIHSVDPRYLGLPNYDLAYTLAARERLDARLRAAEQLGLTGDPGLGKLLERVVQADGLLEEHLRGRGGSGAGPKGDTGTGS